MLRRLLAVLLVLSLAPSTVFAESLRDAITRSSETLAQQRAVRSARNPYKMPAIALIGAGAGLLVIGLAQDRGAEVNASGASVSVTEKGGSKTALTVLGIAAAGAGGFLWFWGEQKRGKIAPVIAVSHGTISVRTRIRF